MKTTLTSCLAKQRCIDFSASIMAERSVMIASPVTAELGDHPSTRPFKNPLLCKWSFDPAIMTTCGSMFTTLCTLIAIPTACPQSRLGAVRKIRQAKRVSRRIQRVRASQYQDFPNFISRVSYAANRMSPFGDSRCAYFFSSRFTELTRG